VAATKTIHYGRQFAFVIWAARLHLVPYGSHGGP
jgi:hypothetical protein